MSPKFETLLLGALMIVWTSLWFGVIFWAGMRHRDTPRKSPHQAPTDRAGTPTVAELADAERLACQLGVVELPAELEAAVHGGAAERSWTNSRFGHGPQSAQELARTGHARH